MSGKFLLIGQLPPPVHGSNVMAERFHRSLQNIGHEVFIVEKTFSRRQKDVRKLSIVKVFKAPIIALELIRRISLNKPALCFYFVSVMPPSFFFDAFLLFLLRLCRIDYVLYLHGKGLLDLGTKSRRGARFLVNKTLSGSLGAIVLGERLRSDVNRFIPNDRLFVLPNAIPDIDRQMLKHGRNNQRPIQVLFLSNLTPSKGPMEFLQMAKKVLDKCEDVKFIVAGPSRSEAFFLQMKQYIRREGLAGFVSMPGGVYGGEKEKYFRESDIFVLPSYREAFPLVNLEAMQWGVPIISSNEGAIPEMVQDGINGYIVEPKNISKLAECVIHLINDGSLRKNMGMAAREAYECNYTMQAYERKLNTAVGFFLRLKRKK